jgi:hypothetical protein
MGILSSPNTDIKRFNLALMWKFSSSQKMNIAGKSLSFSVLAIVSRQNYHTAKYSAFRA